MIFHIDSDSPATFSQFQLSYPIQANTRLSSHWQRVQHRFDAMILSVETMIYSVKNTTTNISSWNFI